MGGEALINRWELEEADSHYGKMEALWARLRRRKKSRPREMMAKLEADRKKTEGRKESWLLENDSKVGSEDRGP
jgi:hypothetical protein